MTNHNIISTNTPRHFEQPFSKRATQNNETRLDCSKLQQAIVLARPRLAIRIISFVVSTLGSVCVGLL